MRFNTSRRRIFCHGRKTRTPSQDISPLNSGLWIAKVLMVWRFSEIPNKPYLHCNHHHELMRIFWHPNRHKWYCRLVGVIRCSFWKGFPNATDEFMFNTTSRMRISVQTRRLTAGLAKADQKLEYKSENLSTALPVSVVRPLLVPGLLC